MFVYFQRFDEFFPQIQFFVNLEILSSGKVQIGNKTKFHGFFLLFSENAIRHYRAEKFFDASKCCHDAIRYTLTEAERVVVRYCQAMALLASKSLDNVKEGHALLKELYEKRSLNWEKQFPAIFVGLAQYENAVNSKPQFVDIDEESAFNALSYPRKKELIEVFPELDESQAKSMLQKCVDFKPEILATCRYEDCEKVHKKQDKSQVLQWKSNICGQDLDYKGFYTTECTEKCHVDFHPWCWKNKKDNDMIKNDKEYLKQNCSTPDCGAPIAYLKVTKDQGQDPIEFKDEELTKRRLEEFNKAKAKAAEEAKKAKKATKVDLAGDHVEASPKRRSPKTSESSFDDNSTSEDLAKKIEQLKEQLDAKDAELRNANRQLRTVTTEKEKLEKDLEAQKKTSRGHFEDLKKERERKSDEMIRLNQSVDGLRKQNNLLRNQNTTLVKVKEAEICQTINTDMGAYKDFVEFVNEHLVQDPKSRVLEELKKCLENRIEYSNQVLRNNAQGLQGAMGPLYQMPIIPDYNELMMEIINKNQKAEQIATAPVPTTFKELTKMIKEWFPKLEPDDIGNYVVEIKRQKGSLQQPANVFYEFIEKEEEKKNREHECSICFENMNDGRETKTLECKHEFCRRCITKHFEQKSDCPLCRKHHVEPDEYPALPGAKR